MKPMYVGPHLNASCHPVLRPRYYPSDQMLAPEVLGYRSSGMSWDQITLVGPVFSFKRFSKAPLGRVGGKRRWEENEGAWEKVQWKAVVYRQGLYPISNCKTLVNLLYLPKPPGFPYPYHHHYHLDDLMYSIEQPEKL